MLQCDEFVNADEIARGLSPFKPETVSFQAGRIMLKRIDQLIQEDVSFAFETTLSTVSYLKTIEAAKKKGYKIRLFFFWLNDSTLAIKRVKKRIKEGGHSIPEDIIERRYTRGIYNLLNRFIPVCDTWLIIDNSEEPHKFVAGGFSNSVTHIYETETWQNIKDQTHE